ncbi:MAG TPA: PIN domain-containing protein [Conexibacter sp.]|nr:PIN domain-containing protein [Conexibacter sp.]
MAGLTLDAGALIAYERGDLEIRRVLRVAFNRGVTTTIPAVVLAEVWRGDAKDAPVARLLKWCAVEPLDEQRARAAGALRRSTAGAGAIDACVAVGVRERGDVLATSDPDDMRRLLGPRFTVLAV